MSEITNKLNEIQDKIPLIAFFLENNNFGVVSNMEPDQMEVLVSEVLMNIFNNDDENENQAKYKFIGLVNGVIRFLDSNKLFKEYSNYKKFLDGNISDLSEDEINKFIDYANNDRNSKDLEFNSSEKLNQSIIIFSNIEFILNLVKLLGYPNFTIINSNGIYQCLIDKYVSRDQFEAILGKNAVIYDRYDK